MLVCSFFIEPLISDAIIHREVTDYKKNLRKLVILRIFSFTINLIYFVIIYDANNFQHSLHPMQMNGTDLLKGDFWYTYSQYCNKSKLPENSVYALIQKLRKIQGKNDKIKLRFV